MPEEKKESMKTWKIIIIVSNIGLFLLLIAIFAITDKLQFWKPLLKWTSIIGGIQLGIYLILLLVKNIKKKKEQEVPLFLQQKGDELEKAQEAAEKYAWDKFGAIPSKCENFTTGSRVVELKTGQPIQVFVWYFKELVSLKRKEYIIVTLVDDPKQVSHTMLKKSLKEEEISNYAKEIATQKLEIKHSVFTRTDQAGNIIREEHHEPIIPQIMPKEAGKL